MPGHTTSRTVDGDALSDAARTFGHAVGLSIRENELLGLAAAGLADKEISARLGLAYTTIKSYWSRICFKIGVRNRQLAIGKLVADLARRACCADACPDQIVGRIRQLNDDVKEVT